MDQEIYSIFKYTKFTIYDFLDASIFQYNTCTLQSNNEKYVDANLDAPNNAVSGNGPSSEMLTCQSQIQE